MSVLLAICLVGGAVFAKLPANDQPTLRQAIVAAGETPSASLSNLDKQIEGWSYECDGGNYAAAYFIANAAPADFGRLWIARYDDGKKKWTDASSMPPGSDDEQTQALEVITLFYDGYYLYVQLQDASGSPATLQFKTDLTFKREFFGDTLAGLRDFSLVYSPNTDSLPGDPLAAIFDPISGESRPLFPPATPTALVERGDQLGAQQYAACGQQWFDAHGLTVDKQHPFRGLAKARSNVATDSLAFAVVFGSDDPNEVCERGARDPIGAVYVFIHPDDTKRMKFVEQPITDWKDFGVMDLDPLLTKDSLAKLFGSS